MEYLNVISSVLVLVFKIGLISSEKLPEFIKPCLKNDPDLDKCFINRSISAIPELVKGVDYLKIPILSPLFLKEIELVKTENLKLNFYNLTADGLATAKTLSAKVDLGNKSIETEIHFDGITFEGTYSVTGKILILPIEGHGTAKIVFDDILIKFTTDFELLPKNETEYMHFINSKLSYELKHAKYHLNDLFNGDKFLGDQTNKFLNENWETLHQEFSPIISETIKRTVLKILERVVDVIPFNEIFIPE